MVELQPIIVFHGRHFVRHIGICNPMCQTLTDYVQCYSTQFRKNDVTISNRFSEVHKRSIHTHRHTHTHTDTHDDSIRR